MEILSCLPTGKTSRYFFELYLRQIFNSKYGILIDYIIPEFPLRIGEIIDKEVNESFKIDYLCVSQVHQKVYLVELKTDCPIQKK